MPDDRAFLVLNTLYLKKIATAQVIADVTGLPSDEVRETISGLLADGSLLDMNGQLLLQESGTQSVLDYYRDCYRELRDRRTVIEWYDGFETINGQFIKLVTDWQKSEGDERIQERIQRVVDRLANALGELTGVIPRYSQYVRRFERSLALVDQGRHDFLCNPMVDSVHNIWFEFHEDILAVIGRPRDTT